MRVLIVAADPLARAGLAGLLGNLDRVQIVGQVSDQDDARGMVDAFRPDVVLFGLGWDQARLDGLAAYCEVHGVVVVLLGGEVADSSLAVVWATGVRAVLDRAVDVGQLGAALVAVMQGLAVFDPGHSAMPAALMRQGDLLHAPVEPLTAREIEVLQGMANGLSNKLIARDLGISEHTVKYHVNSILGKLEAQTRTDAVVRATRAGLLLL